MFTAGPPAYFKQNASVGLDPKRVAHPLTPVRIKRIDSRFIENAMGFLIGFDDDLERADFLVGCGQAPEKKTAGERKPASGVKGKGHLLRCSDSRFEKVDDPVARKIVKLGLA